MHAFLLPYLTADLNSFITGTFEVDISEEDDELLLSDVFAIANPPRLVLTGPSTYLPCHSNR